MYRAQKYIAFLLMMPLGASAMEPAPQKNIYDDQEWSQCTHKVTKDPKTGEKTYVGTYSVNVPQGFVKVKTAAWCLYECAKPEDIHITIYRHAKQQIVVTAVLVAKIAELSDMRDKSALSSVKSYGFWTPWLTDIVRHSEDLSKVISRVKLRGNNRLYIKITEPGRYSIMLPEDADIQVDTKIGNIDYKSTLPTMLYAKAKTVNREGDSGGHTPKGEAWHYGSAYSNQPATTQTHLITKNGHINVPEKPKL